MFKKLGLALVATAVMGVGTANASTINYSLYDNGTGGQTTAANAVAVWTMSVTDASNCGAGSLCDVTLGVKFLDVASSPYFGAGFEVYLDQIQFALPGNVIRSITQVGGSTTSPLENSIWAWRVQSGLDTNGCSTNGQPNQAGCGDWAGATNTSLGLGKLFAGAEITWLLRVGFQEKDNDPTPVNFVAGNGNIRAAFNKVMSDGTLKNMTNFSPNGTTYTQCLASQVFDPATGACKDKDTVPEPTSMLLLGAGLVGLAARLRHKN